MGFPSAQAAGMAHHTTFGTTVGCVWTVIVAVNVVDFAQDVGKNVTGGPFHVSSRSYEDSRCCPIESIAVRVTGLRFREADVENDGR